MTTVTVKTDVNSAGQIATQVDQHDNTGFWETLGRRVIDTRDAQVRQSLIDLGWTPPGQAPHVADAAAVSAWRDAAAAAVAACPQLAMYFAEADSVWPEPVARWVSAGTYPSLQYANGYVAQVGDEFYLSRK